MEQLHQPDILSWRLKNADSTIRLFITFFLITLTAGYIIGLAFVDHKTKGTPGGLSEEYRGTPEGSQVEELKYAKSEEEMYIFLHNHILSLSIVFLAVGGIFYFSSVSPGWKKFLMVEPLAAIVTTFGGIWLMRFVSESFSYIVILSGISMVGCYCIMVGFILKELWLRK